MRSVMSKSLEHAARWFHALADETRLRIVRRLSEGEQCVCDLTDVLGTGQSLLSFHLKTLKEAGILRDRREGRWVYYSLNFEAIEEIEKLVGSLKAMNGRFQGALKCCE
jgi:ArsR family transcriptional regulator